MSKVLISLISIGLLGIMMGVATTGITMHSVQAVAQCGRNCDGDSPDDTKRQLAQSLRQIAQKINNDPPKSDIVSKLINRANQLDPDCGISCQNG